MAKIFLEFSNTHKINLKGSTIEEMYRSAVLSNEWKKLKDELMKTRKGRRGHASFNYKGEEIKVERAANSEINEK